MPKAGPMPKTEPGSFNLADEQDDDGVWVWRFQM